MPLKRMPNGEVVEVPEGISAQALAKIEAQYKVTRKERGDAPRTEIKNRQPTAREQAFAERQKPKRVTQQIAEAVNPFNWFGGMPASGMLANFDDELQGVGRALGEVTKGGSASKGYEVGREIRNQEKQEYRRDNPITSTVAEIAGSLAMPVGTGATALRGAGSVLSRIAPRAGEALGRAGARVANAGSVTKGGLIGANAGTLNAAGSSENIDQTAGDAALGGVVGAGLGVGLGTLGRAVQGGARILRDRSGKQAKTVAAQQVQKMLERGDITPEQANKMIQKANREGGDMMLMDVTPGLTSEAGVLSRNTNLKNANKLIQRGESRAEARRGRIAGKIEDTAELPSGVGSFDALREGDILKATRGAMGQRQYAQGGVMDGKIEWTDEVENAVKSAPNFQKMMVRAVERARQFGDDIAAQVNGERVPSMRVWDYLKRAYDEEIGPMVRAGNREGAAAYSAELGRIKEQIIKANPGYAKILTAQRDYFQRQEALEMGSKLWKDLAKNPRQTNRYLDDLAAENPSAFDEARVGMIDKLINDVLTSSNPVSVLTKVKNEQATRRAMETLFGDKTKYNRFMRYLRTEAKGAQADAMTRYSGQSQTSRMSQANAGTSSDLAELGVAGAAGGAFGGVMGAVANPARRMMQMAKVISESAQDEIAKMLMSKGGDEFLEAMRNAVELTKKQTRNNERLTRTVGKTGQQPFTTEIGGE